LNIYIVCIEIYIITIYSIVFSESDWAFASIDLKEEGKTPAMVPVIKIIVQNNDIVFLVIGDNPFIIVNL